jgi:alkyldihydroxyacetonephosphate synthase
MDTDSTLSRRPLRRFWGWGLASDALDAREQLTVRAMLAHLGAHVEDRPSPQVGDFILPAPRIRPPAALAGQFSAAPLDRLNHCAGKSYAD